MDELIQRFNYLKTFDHQTLIQEFSKVFQVNEYVARFYLEVSQWNIEMAVQNYLESQLESTTFIQKDSLPMISKPEAKFTGDLAPWQTRSFQPGTNLPIRLIIQNTGSTPWPLDTQLVFVDGEQMTHLNNIPVSANPSNSVEIILTLCVPDKEGSHLGSWRLVCSAGYFGEPIFMIVNSQHSALPVSFSESDFNYTNPQIISSVAESQIEQLLLASKNLTLDTSHDNTE